MAFKEKLEIPAEYVFCKILQVMLVHLNTSYKASVRLVCIPCFFFALMTLITCLLTIPLQLLHWTKVINLTCLFEWL